jgi:hypothetical protein
MRTIYIPKWNHIQRNGYEACSLSTPSIVL